MPQPAHKSHSSIADFLSAKSASSIESAQKVQSFVVAAKYPEPRGSYLMSFSSPIVIIAAFPNLYQSKIPRHKRTCDTLLTPIGPKYSRRFNYVCVKHRIIPEPELRLGKHLRMCRTQHKHSRRSYKCRRLLLCMIRGILKRKRHI